MTRRKGIRPQIVKVTTGRRSYRTIINRCVTTGTPQNAQQPSNAPILQPPSQNNNSTNINDNINDNSNNSHSNVAQMATFWNHNNNFDNFDNDAVDENNNMETINNFDFDAVAPEPGLLSTAANPSAIVSLPRDDGSVLLANGRACAFQIGVVGQSRAPAVVCYLRMHFNDGDAMVMACTLCSQHAFRLMSYVGDSCNAEKNTAPPVCACAHAAAVAACILGLVAPLRVSNAALQRRLLEWCVVAENVVGWHQINSIWKPNTKWMVRLLHTNEIIVLRYEDNVLRCPYCRRSLRNPCHHIANHVDDIEQLGLVDLSYHPRHMYQNNNNNNESDSDLSDVDDVADVSRAQTQTNEFHRNYLLSKALYNCTYKIFYFSASITLCRPRGTLNHQYPLSVPRNLEPSVPSVGPEEP
jgi:hypothetical protein